MKKSGFFPRRKRKRSVRIFLVAIAIVLFWRGAWSLLDLYLPANSLLSWLSIAVAVFILYLDDFHLGELE